MNEWAHGQLRMWGVWAAQRSAGGWSRGLVAQYGVRALAPAGGTSGAYIPIVELETLAIDGFVARLPPELLRVAREVYCGETTIERHAQRLRMSKRTLYERLACIHLRFEEWHAERKDCKKEFRRVNRFE